MRNDEMTVFFFCFFLSNYIRKFSFPRKWSFKSFLLRIFDSIFNPLAVANPMRLVIPHVNRSEFTGGRRETQKKWAQILYEGQIQVDSNTQKILYADIKI